MNTIFLSFANSRAQPLPTLQQEEEQVYGLIDRFAKLNQFHIHRDSYATTTSITQYLISHQKHINLFLYSGHADRDHLLLEDKAANADGIAALLGVCPKLKVAILNGCSSAGQVEALLKHGVPIVIATNAPIDDFKATQFSIAFFQQLAEQNGSIESAFDIGVAAAQTISEHALPIQRGIVNSKTKSKNPWGIFYREESSAILSLQLRDRLEKVRPAACPKCFLMYDFEDRDKVSKLKKFLYLMERREEIEIFDMHAYEFGDDRDAEIQAHLEDADYVFCLITFMFLFSTYELAVKAKALNKRIIPIRINVVSLEDTFFSRLRTLPSNRKAIAEWSNEDAAYMDVVKYLRLTLKK